MASQVEVSLSSYTQDKLYFQSAYHWRGYPTFPNIIDAKLDEEPTTVSFKVDMPVKAGIVYKGHDQNGIYCSWLVAFSAIGGEKPIKQVHAETGLQSKYENFSWDEILAKLDDSDAVSKATDPELGNFACAEIIEDGIGFLVNAKFSDELALVEGNI